MNYCYGVDVGGTTVKIGLLKEDGTLIEKWEIRTRVENDGEAILPDVANALTQNMEKHKLTQGDIIGVGIGIPGPVDKDGVVEKTANLGWGYKQIKREAEDLLKLPVKVGNDANVAALGEMWKGGGAGYENLLLITLGTGVGGGIVINGQALVGEHGAGGEIGHITVNPHETLVCGCGRKGCLEQYTSATGIRRLALRRMEKDDMPSSLRGQENLSAKMVFDAMKEGDGLAVEVVEQFGEILGDAIANISIIIDPAIVVIGGGVSKAGVVLLDCVQKYFRRAAFFANTETKFALATLGNDAGIYGAAKLVL